jgi:hypothetical protein
LKSGKQENRKPETRQAGEREAGKRETGSRLPAVPGVSRPGLEAIQIAASGENGRLKHVGRI